MKQLLKYAFLMWMGGSLYLEVELLWRGYSYWTMFFTGGLIFVIIGLLNEVWTWADNLIKQIVVGTLVCTAIEFIVGMIFNVGLGWNMWDYSALRFNLFGQVSLPYMLLWIPLVTIAIFVDDIVRHVFFHEQRPIYWIGSKHFQWRCFCDECR